MRTIIISLLAVVCLGVASCATGKHYRDQQGVLKTEHRSTEGINTGAGQKH